MTARLATQARIITAIEAERNRPNREASGEAINLWRAACILQERGLEGVDVGLALVVRDKLDAMLAALREPINPVGEDEHGA